MIKSDSAISRGSLPCFTPCPAFQPESGKVVQIVDLAGQYYDDAKADYERALALDPANPQLQKDLQMIDAVLKK